MLTGARFCNDPGLAHAARQQYLPQTIVDLVRAGVIELIAFEIDLGAAKVFCQPFGKIQWTRTTGIMGVEIGKFRLIGRVGFGKVPGVLQFKDQGHQGFCYKSTAEYAETAFFIRS